MAIEELDTLPDGCVPYNDDGYVMVHKDGPVAQVILNRPEKLNALIGDMGQGVKRAFQDIDEDDEIRVVLFRGVGRAFSTGGDMGWIGNQYGGPDDDGRRPSQRRRLGRDDRGYRVFESILHSSKCVIAEGKGYVLGVALDWFLGADIIICSDETVLGYPPARMISASGVSTLYWMFRMGAPLHAEITMMGRNIGAQEAYDRGLINRVVAREQLNESLSGAVDAVCAVPVDGLHISKFNKRVAYDILGVRSSQLQSAMGHAMQVQQRMEKDDWNLMKERQEGGTRGAIESRDKRFRDAIQRYNPDGPAL